MTPTRRTLALLLVGAGLFLAVGPLVRRVFALPAPSLAEGQDQAPNRRELTLTATYSSSPADLAEAFDLIQRGAIRVAELVSHRVPLERLAEAVGLMERREALKVFVEVGRETGGLR